MQLSETANNRKNNLQSNKNDHNHPFTMYKHQSTTQQINLEQESNLRHEIDKSIVSKSKEMTITKETMLDIVQLDQSPGNA